MRTRQEIASEVAALKALKPVGRYKFRTAASIALALQELEHGVDQSAGDWDELGEEQRAVVWRVFAWKEGSGEERPSEGWGELVE